MEFYAHAKVDMSPIGIQRWIRIPRLADLCSSIEKVLSHEGERGEIYCVWGEFKVHLELIQRGVRFSLPGCPNALQWTITTANDKPGHLRIHCTIEQTEHDEDFIESIQQFVDDWRQGLEDDNSMKKKCKSPGGANCLPVYG